MQTPDAVPKQEYSAMPSTPAERLAILTSLYQAMVSIAQELRQTTERLTVGGNGLLLAATSWMLSRQPLPPTKQRIVTAIGMLMFVALAVAVIRTLQRRYNGVAEATRNINYAQGTHSVGVFLEDRPLFPVHWQQFGTSEWREPIFFVAYCAWFAVGVGCAFALVTF